MFEKVFSKPGEQMLLKIELLTGFGHVGVMGDFCKSIFVDLRGESSLK